jgi:hypothetical protein
MRVDRSLKPAEIGHLRRSTMLPWWQLLEYEVCMSIVKNGHRQIGSSLFHEHAAPSDLHRVQVL